MRITIDESLVPVQEEVQGACETLGFDPLYVANEGRLVAFVPQKDAIRALSIMQNNPLAQEACIIGSVGERENRKRSCDDKKPNRRRAHPRHDEWGAASTDLLGT